MVNIRNVPRLNTQAEPHQFTRVLLCVLSMYTFCSIVPKYARNCSGLTACSCEDLGILIAFQFVVLWFCLVAYT